MVPNLWAKAVSPTVDDPGWTSNRCGENASIDFAKKRIAK